MSLLSRVFAPPATHDLAGVVTGLLSNLEGAPPTELPASQAPGRLPGPTGLGTAAARAFSPSTLTEAGSPAKTRWSPGPSGLGTTAARVSSGGSGVPELYCPGPVRDDPALGETVNERLVEWAAEVGIYPGQLDKVRSANFGRLIMLAHPDSMAGLLLGVRRG